MMSLFIFSKNVSLLIKVCMLLYLALTGVFNPEDSQTHSRLPEPDSLLVVMSETKKPADVQAFKLVGVISRATL